LFDKIRKKFKGNAVTIKAVYDPYLEDEW